SRWGRFDAYGTASRFHENYLTDGLAMPNVLQVYSGQTVALPPEVLVIGFAEGNHSPNGCGHLDTHLRCTFALSTPFILGGVAPTLTELTPERRSRYLRYATIYKTFIRPLLATCRMYHHAPVHGRGGVTSSEWFAVEFASPDRAKGWAVIVRLGIGDSDTLVFRARGLDPARRYAVTFDSLDATPELDGLQLMRDGLPIRLESVLSSELLLFEGKPILDVE
ncbi:MAG: hypothetical protein ACP5R5_11130, partial [Armatimonadota bacterium]